VNILSITVNKPCWCDREREWSRVHPFVAIVLLLISDALDSREQTGYTRIKSIVVVVVASQEEKRKQINCVYTHGSQTGTLIVYYVSCESCFGEFPRCLSDAPLIISLITPINVIATDATAYRERERERERERNAEARHNDLFNRTTVRRARKHDKNLMETIIPRRIRATNGA